MPKKPILVGQSPSILASAIASAQWCWSVVMSRIYGTLPGITVGETIAEGGGLTTIPTLGGCLVLIVAALAIVAALILIGLILYHPAPLAEKQNATRIASQGQDKLEGGATHEVPTRESSPQIVKRSQEKFDEGELQAQRLRALSSGNMSEYNRLLQHHLQLYEQHHISPCISGFFPEGCSQATDSNSENPPPKSGPGSESDRDEVEALGTGDSRKEREPKPPVDPGEQGEIIGWGTRQSKESVEQTRSVTDSLTPEKVKDMIAKGLDKDWLLETKGKYEANLRAGRMSRNAQAIPRYELVNKILELWPN
jgi:hypothetical protein